MARKAFATDLKTIYLAESEKAGRTALDIVSQKWSEKYPHQGDLNNACYRL